MLERRSLPRSLAGKLGRLILLSILLLPSASVGAPATGSALPFVLKQVAPGVYAAIDGPGHEAGANAGFVIGDDGVLVVDSFFHPDAARALVGEIRRITSKPIRYLVNTHYHVDHTGGDQVFRDAGAIIIAHRNVRGWIRTNNLHLLGDRATSALKQQIQALPLPDLVTDNDLTVWLGSREIEVRTVLGHTGGDLAIYVPDAKVLFTGDLLWRRVPPNLIDGSLDQWAATDLDFARMAGSARILFVPGHGGLADVGDVEDFRSYLLDLRRLVSAGRSAGLAGEALRLYVAPRLRSAHPAWVIGDRALESEVADTEQELAGTKKRPIPVPPSTHDLP